MSTRANMTFTASKLGRLKPFVEQSDCSFLSRQNNKMINDTHDLISNENEINPLLVVGEYNQIPDRFIALKEMHQSRIQSKPKSIYAIKTSENTIKDTINSQIQLVMPVPK